MCGVYLTRSFNVESVNQVLADVCVDLIDLFHFRLCQGVVNNDKKRLFLPPNFIAVNISTADLST